MKMLERKKLYSRKEANKIVQTLLSCEIIFDIFGINISTNFILNHNFWIQYLSNNYEKLRRHFPASYPIYFIANIMSYLARMKETRYRTLIFYKTASLARSSDTFLYELLMQKYFLYQKSFIRIVEEYIWLKSNKKYFENYFKNQRLSPLLSRLDYDVIIDV